MICRCALDDHHMAGQVDSNSERRRAAYDVNFTFQISSLNGASVFGRHTGVMECNSRLQSLC